jgi:hypothetical protein
VGVWLTFYGNIQADNEFLMHRVPLRTRLRGRSALWVNLWYPSGDTRAEKCWPEENWRRAQSCGTLFCEIAKNESCNGGSGRDEKGKQWGRSQRCEVGLDGYLRNRTKDIRDDSSFTKSTEWKNLPRFRIARAIAVANEGAMVRVAKLAGIFEE